MEPTVERWSSADEFLGAARDFLGAREAEHCLLFGLASTIANHPEVYPEPRFWTVRDGERVVAAALRTPPHNLILSQVDEPRWLAPLAADVLASDEAPGVARSDGRRARARRHLVRTHRPRRRAPGAGTDLPARSRHPAAPRTGRLPGGRGA